MVIVGGSIAGVEGTGSVSVVFAVVDGDESVNCSLRRPGTLACPGVVFGAILANNLVRVDIKALSDCEESNACVVQSVHGRLQCGVHGVLPDFVREREVLRVGPLSSEAVVEIDRPLLVRMRCGIARI